MPISTCPCGGKSFAACCEPYLTGAAIAPTAEALMRSRYTAFTRRDEAYLRATWHPSTVPAEPIIDSDVPVQWLGLEVKSALRLRKRQTERQTERKDERELGIPANLPEEPDADTVEFVARYRVNGKGHRLHEVSRFVREHDGGKSRWFYLDGSFPD